MRQLALVIVAAILGFAGAWWMLHPATTHGPAPRVETRIDAGPPPTSVEANEAPATADRPLRYEDIGTGATVFDQLFIAWRLAAESRVDQLAPLAERALDERDPLYDEVVSIFLERYTALDPEAAMEFVTANGRLNQSAMQGHVLTSWIRQDPDQAFSWFQRIANPQIKLSIGARLLDDPTLAQSGLPERIAAELGPRAGRIRNQLEMRRSDPATLFESALTLTGFGRQSRLNYAVARWAQQDPVATLARLRDLPSPDERRSLMRIAVTQFAQQNAQGALEYLHANAPDDTTLQAQILEVMARQDPTTALPHVEEFVSRTGQRDPLNSLLSSWAAQDPRGATAYADTIYPAQRGEAYLSVAMGYATQRPEEALNWALGLGQEYARVQQLTLNRVANQYPAVAEQALARVSSEASRTMIITAVARIKARTDPLAALDWLSQFRREAGYAAAYRDTLAQHARQDPEAAARLLDTANADQPRYGLAGIIASTWYERDAAAAIQWVLALSDSDERNRAIGQLVGRMSGTDPERAMELADRLPPGDPRDRSLLQIAMAIVARDPGRYDEVVARLQLPPRMIDQLRAFKDSAARRLAR